MSRTVPSWLDDPVAMVVGEGEGVEAVAHELAAAGATIGRGPYAESIEEADSALDALSRAARDPVTLLVHASPVHQIEIDAANSADTWRGEIGPRLDSPFFYSAALVRRLFDLKSGGAILFLSRPWAQASSAAAASDAALQNLTKTLSVEWARDGIRTNMVQSGFLDGGSKTELRSLGALASYLMSDYAAYVTGCIMGVDETDV